MPLNWYNRPLVMTLTAGVMPLNWYNRSLVMTLTVSVMPLNCWCDAAKLLA
jgi:hypothetical protein